LSPSKIRRVVVAERIAWTRQMIANIRSLPLDDRGIFLAEKMYAASAESYLRRALEAVMDIGRHILAKGFAIAAGEYKIIGKRLRECGVIDSELENIFDKLAGYRNRMTHFYHEVTEEELYDICSTKLADVELIINSMALWLENHPDMID